MAKQSIAIIGISGRFPGAVNPEQLYDNLSKGSDHVTDLPDSRKKATALPPDGDYMVAGYLSDIDLFDYRLFNFSYTEAINMSPAHRLPLEVVYEAIENAGYDISHFSGTNTAVFATDSVKNDYASLATEFNPTLVTGNSPEFLATTISRYFNFLGNSMLINTACSSAMICIKTACNELVTGDADVAVVCGVNIGVVPVQHGQADLGLASGDGRSRAFSGEESGMSYGEMVVALILKPLEKAVADNDHIHAVITGWAANNNGMKSSSIMAPHSELQAEVIRKAWQKAGIDPEQIGFIEAHGSGTPLGDTLEIEGLSMAFSSYTNRVQFVPLSTIKSNIGHGMAASGIAGVVKTVLSLKHQVLFPAIHCRTLNPNINFDASPVYVHRAFTPWVSNTPRIAGVTSLGRGGVNCHLVLEEYITPSSATVDSGEPFLITVSGNSPESLQKNIQRLRNRLNVYPLPALANISYTRNCGRKHYEQRWATIVTDLPGLITELDRALEAPVSMVVPDKIFLLFPDEQLSAPEITAALTACKVLQRVYDAVWKEMSDALPAWFCLQIACYRLLQTAGITPEGILSVGSGKIAKDLALKNITRAEANALLASFVREPENLVADRLHLFAAREGATPMLVINLGQGNFISHLLGSEQYPHIGIHHFLQSSADGWCALLKMLYLCGMTLPWPDICSRQGGRRIELPTYAFDSTRCWIRDEPVSGKKKESGKPVPADVLNGAGNDLEKKLASLFAEILELETLTLTANFFELGGNSLKASKVINRINEFVQEKLDFEDIYDYPSVAALAGLLSPHLNAAAVLAGIWKETLKVTAVSDDSDFFASGGHSLLANQLINRIKSFLGIQLSFEDIFKHARLSAMTALLQQRLQPGTTPSPVKKKQIVPAEKRDRYPVTFAQQRIIHLEKIRKANTAYNSVNIFLIEGALEVDRMNNALQRLVELHEPLRTSLRFAAGKPVQVVLDKVAVAIEVEECTAIPVNSALQEVVGEEVIRFVKPFNLDTPPLIRMKLLRLATGKWLLFYDISHAISDRVTSSILVKDFMQLYNGKVLSPPPVQYKDLAVWQYHRLQKDRLREHEHFWTSVFEKEVPPLPLPVDHPPAAIPDTNGDIFDFAIRDTLAAKIRELARTNNTTTYILLLSVLNVWLHKLTGVTDVTIGAPYSQRNNIQLENMAGILLNTLVFRNAPEPDKLFTDFLREVKDHAAEVYSHHEYPFELLLEKLKHQRQPGKGPLFNVLFNSQTIGNRQTLGMYANDASLTMAGLKFTPFYYKAKYTSFDLSVDVDELEDLLHFKVYYRTSIFEKSTIQYLTNEFVQLLDLITATPHLPLSAYTIFRKKSTNLSPARMTIRKHKNNISNES